MSLKNKTSSGHDDINNTLAKKLVNSISVPLCIIYNKSINECKLPSSLKIAQVVPLYKGKSKELITNYRPISLLPVFSKIIEKLVYDQVYSYLINTKTTIKKSVWF